MTDSPPTEDPRPEKGDRKPSPKSLLLVNTGDGKGKSSAAFGVVMRALGRGHKAAVVQFLKSEKWSTGEEAMADQIGLSWLVGGKGFSWESDDLADDEAIAQASWKTAQHIIQSDEYQLIVLDEITYPLNWGWISLHEVLETLSSRPERVSIIATGRDAPQELLDIADTATEMRKIKHAYDKGIMAKKGIDY